MAHAARRCHCGDLSTDTALAAKALPKTDLLFFKSLLVVLVIGAEFLTPAQKGQWFIRKRDDSPGLFDERLAPIKNPGQLD